MLKCAAADIRSQLASVSPLGYALCMVTWFSAVTSQLTVLNVRVKPIGQNHLFFYEIDIYLPFPTVWADGSGTVGLKQDFGNDQ